MKEQEAKPVRVVLAPDVFACSFFDPVCRRILECWRDGEIRPVATRDLLKEYVVLLHSLGIPRDVLRRWVVWFTTPETSDFWSETSPEKGNIYVICSAAALLGGARLVITASEKWRKSGQREVSEVLVSWITAKEHLNPGGQSNPDEY